MHKVDSTNGMGVGRQFPKFQNCVQDSARVTGNVDKVGNPALPTATPPCFTKM